MHPTRMFSMRPLLSAKPDLPPSLREALARTDCDALLALVEYGLHIDEAAELLDLRVLPACLPC
jgi:hypothetical protein